MARQIIDGLFISTVIMFLNANAQEKQPVRPINFTPFKYKYSVEELLKLYSNDIMKRASEANDQMQELIKRSPYKTDFDKLDKHRLPEWFKDAKLGIFLDWGLWSAAGAGAKGYHGNYYPDTYLGHMYEVSSMINYHKTFWGNDFERDDFIPLFTGTNFDSDKFAKQCVNWGAKYVVPFSKHQDGYCIWDNSYSHRDAVDMPPYKDLLKSMYESFRANNLKCGFYQCTYEFEYPLIYENKIILRKANAVNDPKDAKENQYLAFDSKKHNRMISGKIPVKDYVSDYFVPYMKEVIDKYDPDILWYDAEWYNKTSANKTDLITSYFYNNAEGRKEVAVNDRLGTDSREKHGDFYTSEFHVINENFEKYWEENRPLGFNYGYSWTENDSTVISSEELIKMFTRIVARNGNLMVLINPDASGRLPEYQAKRLDDLGKWLGVNGEAIYSSRPSKTPAEFSNLGDDVWYTQSKNGKYTYAFLFKWPKRGYIELKSAHPKWETKAYLLGYDKPLFSYDNPVDGMYVELPKEMKDPSKRPCEHVWVVRFENW